MLPAGVCVRPAGASSQSLDDEDEFMGNSGILGPQHYPAASDPMQGNSSADLLLGMGPGLDMLRGSQQCFGPQPVEPLRNHPLPSFRPPLPAECSM